VSRARQLSPEETRLAPEEPLRELGVGVGETQPLEPRESRLVLLEPEDRVPVDRGVLSVARRIVRGALERELELEGREVDWLEDLEEEDRLGVEADLWDRELDRLAEELDRDELDREELGREMERLAPEEERWLDADELREPEER